jgi:hypothetical protein
MEIIIPYCENNTKHKNTLHGENVEVKVLKHMVYIVAIVLLRRELLIHRFMQACHHFICGFCRRYMQ